MHELLPPPHSTLWLPFFDNIFELFQTLNEVTISNDMINSNGSVWNSQISWHSLFHRFFVEQTNYSVKNYANYSLNWTMSEKRKKKTQTEYKAERRGPCYQINWVFFTHSQVFSVNSNAHHHISVLSCIRSLNGPACIYTQCYGTS